MGSVKSRVRGTRAGVLMNGRYRQYLPVRPRYTSKLHRPQYLEPHDNATTVGRIFERIRLAQHTGHLEQSPSILSNDYSSSYEVLMV